MERTDHIETIGSECERGGRGESGERAGDVARVVEDKGGGDGIARGFDREAVNVGNMKG